MSVHSNVKHIQEYVYDFAVDGGAVGAIDLSAKVGKNPLPVGSVVLAVTAKVVTAFTSGGAATLAWGPTASATGYSGTAVAVASLTDNSMWNGQGNGASLIFDDTQDADKAANVAVANDGDFKVTIGTAAMTAGKAVFVVEFIKPTLS